MSGPLAGIRVLDLGRFAACPVCGMLLADLGAEVIRIEKTGGEEDRFHGLISSTGDNYFFINRNRNKKAITLNLAKNDKAKEIFNELVKRSDVVIDSFSASAAEAIGITYDNLKAVKPDIIFAHVSAFGISGPYSNRLGFDSVAKAMSGTMTISGFPGNPPTRDQVPWVDYSTACLTTVGVLAALYHRQATGQGQMIDTSLLQTAILYIAPVIAEWETGKKRREQTGNRIPYLGVADTYKTKDGKWVLLAVLTNPIWRRFCRSIGKEDWATDPRFPNDLARWEHRDIIDPVVSEWVATQTAEEVVTTMQKIPAPCSICYEQTEVAHNPQVKAEEMLTWLTLSDGRKLPVSSPPFRMSETSPEIKRSFPAIGENNEEIYCGLLGYSHEDLGKFKEEGVI